MNPACGHDPSIDNRQPGQRWPAPCKAGVPYTYDQCRVCWLELNPVEERPKPIPRRTLPCIHLGETTGERRTCPTCEGHVEVKLRKCSVFVECTTHKPLENLACCMTCSQYLPLTLYPAS